VEFRQMPWKRLESELARQHDSAVQCAFAMSRTAERERYLDFGKVPMWATDYRLFVRAGDNGTASLESLKGRTIGVRSGFRLPESIAEGVAAGRWNVAEVGSDAVNFQKLLLKRVDAVLVDGDAGQYMLRQQKLQGAVHMLDPPLMHLDTYLVFKKSADSKVLAEAFDRALTSMAHDGTKEQVQARFLNTPID
jgi:polar amino acid transport system substrate-binding protein